MAQNTIIEFLYTRVSTNKFFFRTRFHKSPQERPSSVGSATALLQGRRGYSRLHCGSLTRFAVKIFSMSCLTQERRKVQYRRATYKKSINSLSAKSVLAGEKLVATYSIYTQEQYIIFYVKQKLGAPKSTYRHNAQIGKYRTILTSKKRQDFDPLLMSSMKQAS